MSFDLNFMLVASGKSWEKLIDNFIPDHVSFIRFQISQFIEPL